MGTPILSVSRSLAVSAVCSLALSAVLISTPVMNVRASGELPRVEHSETIARLTADLQALVNTQKRIEGQGINTAVAVRLERRPAWLIINLSDSDLPRNRDYRNGVRYITAEFEDLLHGIETTPYDCVRSLAAHGMVGR